MKISIILLLLIIVALFEHNSTFHFPNGIVYNGRRFKIEDYPYVMFVKIKTSSTSYIGCTGTLVQEMFVLTAAHCCHNQAEEAVEVNQGSPLGRNLDIHKVVKIYIHEDYDPDKNPHGVRGDLCVLQLEKAFPNIKTFSKIGGSSKDFANGKKLRCTMIGFGDTANETRRGLSGYMMTNDVVHGETACKYHEREHMKKSWTQYLCLIPNGESTPCIGDSGGPMICNKLQYGVCSFGFPYTEKAGDGGCGIPDQQEIYSFIYFYKKWLDNIIEPKDKKKKKKKKKKSSGNLLKPHHILHIILSISLYNILTFI